ncbi:MAG: class I SAM-dependent methyltransferase [Acidimicrobiales bacterium]
MESSPRLARVAAAPPGAPAAGRAQDGGGGASRGAIEHHYDVGADFYRLWLDRRMVYSCAWPEGPDGSLWSTGPDGDGLGDDGLGDDEAGRDLEAAQTAKLAWHAVASGGAGARRVLDVGCGWGSLMGYLVDEAGTAHVTGLTLSRDQAAVVAALGDPRIEVRLEDWRDHRPDTAYDAIVSIGAFEHFARHDLSDAARAGVYRGFFERAARWLPAGGRLSLQTIAYDDYQAGAGPVSSFFAEDIFPESGLPYLGDVVAASDPWWRTVALRADPAHYSWTLARWQGRLEANRDRAVELVGRETYRRYLRYLRVSRAMFDRRVATLYRVVLERRARPRMSGAGR